MNLSLMFYNLLNWIIGFVLYVPFTLLKLIGNVLPTCSSFGITSFSASVTENMVHWIKFTWPIIQYVPWNFIWNYLSAITLYIFFKWMWNHLPNLMHFVIKFWWIVVIFYVLAWSLNTFTGDAWKDSAMFNQIFGVIPTSTGVITGGGGGSW